VRFTGATMGTSYDLKLVPTPSETLPTDFQTQVGTFGSTKRFWLCRRTMARIQIAKIRLSSGLSSNQSFNRSINPISDAKAPETQEEPYCFPP